MSIRKLEGIQREGAIPQLATILADCVQDGASVRTTMVLDSDSDSDAVRLYRGLGWEESGSVPRYCLAPDGRLKATTFIYKLL
jgi:hypothetical protein